MSNIRTLTEELADARQQIELLRQTLQTARLEAEALRLARDSALRVAAWGPPRRQNDSTNTA